MKRARPDDRYTDAAIALHWVLAIAIAATFALGFYMSDLKLSPTRIKLFNWHKWAGITILLASAARLAWRAGHPPPPPAAGTSPVQQRIAEWTHRLLYVFFFVIPLFGWAHSSAAGFQVVWFKLIPLPDFVPVDKALAKTLAQVHGALAYSMAGVVVLHAAAALKHHWFDRDQVLRRMLPARASTAAPSVRAPAAAQPPAGDL
jgi:cytochrome b561